MSRRPHNQLQQAAMDGDLAVLRCLIGVVDDQEKLRILVVAVERGHRHLVEHIWPMCAPFLHRSFLLTYKNMRLWPDLMRVMARWFDQEVVDRATLQHADTLGVVQEMKHLISPRCIHDTFVKASSLGSVEVMEELVGMIEEGALVDAMEWAINGRQHKALDWLLDHTAAVVTVDVLYHALRCHRYEMFMQMVRDREIVITTGEATVGLQQAAVAPDAPHEVVDWFMARGDIDAVAQRIGSDPYMAIYFMDQWRKEKAMQQRGALWAALDDVVVTDETPSKM